MSSRVREDLLALPEEENILFHTRASLLSEEKI